MYDRAMQALAIVFNEHLPVGLSFVNRGVGNLELANLELV